MPADHDGGGHDLGRNRLCDRPNEWDASHLAGHFRRQAEKHQRRRDETQHDVLQHVDAVEVVVAEGVDRRLERNPEREKAEAEVKRMLGLGVVNSPGKPGVAEEEPREARIDAGIERPAHAMSLGDHPPAVIGWARIQRLVIVYMTISSSIGYWLSSARCAVPNFSPALRCECYTAMTCPPTMSTSGTRVKAKAVAVVMRSARRLPK